MSNSLAALLKSFKIKIQIQSNCNKPHFTAGLNANRTFHSPSTCLWLLYFHLARDQGELCSPAAAGQLADTSKWWLSNFPSLPPPSHLPTY